MEKKLFLQRLFTVAKLPPVLAATEVNVPLSTGYSFAPANVRFAAVRLDFRQPLVDRRAAAKAMMMMYTIISGLVYPNSTPDH